MSEAIRRRTRIWLPLNSMAVIGLRSFGGSIQLSVCSNESFVIVPEMEGYSSSQPSSDRLVRETLGIIHGNHYLLDLSSFN
jgi:hypothetical protein